MEQSVRGREENSWKILGLMRWEPQEVGHDMIWVLTGVWLLCEERTIGGSEGKSRKANEKLTKVGQAGGYGSSSGGDKERDKLWIYFENRATRKQG